MIAGCAPDDVLFLPFPPIESGSLVIAIEQTSGDERFIVRATDVDAETERLPLEEVERDEDVQIDVLLYPVSLEEMSLTGGPLAPAGRDEPARPIPASDDVHRLALPTESPAWTAVPEPSQRLRDYRIDDPGPAGCATLTAEPFNIPDDTNTVFAAALGGGDVLFGMLSGALFRWSEADGLEPVTRRPGIGISNGVRDTIGGGWWFITSNGALYRGTFASDTELDLTYVTSSGAAVVSGRHSIVVVYENGEPVIYSMRSAGLFERFTENGATTLHAFSTADFGETTILTPAGEIVAAASGDTIVAVRNPDGELVLEDSGAAAGFTSGAYVDGMGVVLGSSEGRFFARSPAGEWSEVGRSPLTVFPYAVTPFRDGFFYGGAFGAGGQYLPGGYCAVQDQLAAFSIQMLVVVPSGILALGDNPNRPMTTAQLIRTTP